MQFMESAGSASAVREQALRFLGLAYTLNLMAMEVQRVNVVRGCEFMRISAIEIAAPKMFA